MQSFMSVVVQSSLDIMLFMQLEVSGPLRSRLFSCVSWNSIGVGVGWCFAVN